MTAFSSDHLKSETPLGEDRKIRLISRRLINREVETSDRAECGFFNDKRSNVRFIATRWTTERRGFLLEHNDKIRLKSKIVRIRENNN